MENIAVFCGSQNGVQPQYLLAATAVGTYLGQQGKHLIYGGGNSGLMGAVANAALVSGAKVTGIIPTFLNSVERQHQGLTTLVVTETMHERKQHLFAAADAAIILPGGFGTLDELFELLTWNQLNLHQIKVIIYDVHNFYGNLLQHIEYMKQQGFLYDNPNTLIAYVTTVDELHKLLQ